MVSRVRLFDMCRAPFPYTGGKADAAATVWAALGDPAHYVETAVKDVQTGQLTGRS